MIVPEGYQQSLSLIRNALLMLSLALFGVQMFIELSWANILCNLLCLAAFGATCHVVFRPRSSRGGAAIIATAIFCSISANSLVPVVGTIMDGHPLVHSLSSPVLTFLHRGIFALILLAAYLVCTSRMARGPRGLLGQVFDALRIRDLLQPGTIWIIGGVGLALTVVRQHILPPDSVVTKFAEGFGFLNNFVFILLVPPYFAELRKRPRWILGLLFFYGIQVGLGITSRMAIIAPVATVGAAWIVAVLAGQIVLQKSTLKKLMVPAIALLVLFGQFQDLSTAMLLERPYRGSRDWMGNLVATWVRFLDKESLAAFEASKFDVPVIANSSVSLWREDYIRNPFLARFTSIKADDNLFFRSLTYGPASVGRIQEITWDKILAQIPGPVLSMINLNVDKAFVNSFSMGDLMDLLSGRGYLGGRKTGSIVAHSYVLFGWFYPACLFGCFLILFIVNQTLGAAARKYGGSINYSSFALFNAFPLFLSFSFDGFHSLASELFRGTLEMVILYAIIRMVAGSFISPMLKGQRVQANPAA